MLTPDVRRQGAQRVRSRNAVCGRLGTLGSDDAGQGARRVPRGVRIAAPRLLLEPEVAGTPQGGSRANQMSEMHDPQVARLVAGRATVDAPDLAACTVGLASCPENRFSVIDHVRAREGPVVRRDGEVPGRVGCQSTGVGGGDAPSDWPQVVENPRCARLPANTPLRSGQTMERLPARSRVHRRARRGACPGSAARCRGGLGARRHGQDRRSAARGGPPGAATRWCTRTRGRYGSDSAAIGVWSVAWGAFLTFAAPCTTLRPLWVTR